MTAYATDFQAMGLSHYQPFQSAFTAVPPKGIDKPSAVLKKRGPKPKASKQVALDQQGRPRVDLAPRTTGAITIYSQADAAKTTRIARGRTT